MDAVVGEVVGGDALVVDVVAQDAALGGVA